MSTNPTLTLYHSPNTRSAGIRILLDELGVEYRLQVLNMQAGEHRQPAYLAINPMGKVPAIMHDGALITEQGAICLYLADAFPPTGRPPPIGDPLRGPYLRWLFFYGSAFEPAVVDRAMQRDAGRASMSPYGDFDTMLSTLTTQLGRGPYVLGERFSAADVVWGAALGWTTRFKLVPEQADIMAYVARIAGRPSAARVRALDGEITATQAAAAGQG